MAAIIYQDNFNRNSTFNGSTPDVGPSGVTWTGTGGGTTSTTGNGQLTPTSGQNFLPFSPTAGNIYTLSYTLNPKAAVNDANIDIGFNNITGDRVAIFYQEVRTVATMRLSVVHNGGTETAIDDPAPNSPTDYQIILNTTNPTWTAEFLWGGVSRTSVNLATPNITRIAFDQSAGGAGAVVTNFSLTSSTAVPEPGTFIPAAVLVAGALLRRRRSRSHRTGRSGRATA
jgi:uncharacterized protein (TIGR03382 family)